jgi:hypothetical protein
MWWGIDERDEAQEQRQRNEISSVIVIIKAVYVCSADGVEQGKEMGLAPEV